MQYNKDRIGGRRVENLKRFWEKFVLRDEMTTEKGYVPAPEKHELLGRCGMALTDLRPAGLAQIGEQRLDVVSEGDFIEKGSRLEVIHVESVRVVVRKVPEDQGT